jgi:hypothetical protein
MLGSAVKSMEATIKIGADITEVINKLDKITEKSAEIAKSPALLINPGSIKNAEESINNLSKAYKAMNASMQGVVSGKRTVSALMEKEKQDLIAVSNQYKANSADISKAKTDQATLTASINTTLNARMALQAAERRGVSDPQRVQQIQNLHVQYLQQRTDLQNIRAEETRLNTSNQALTQTMKNHSNALVQMRTTVRDLTTRETVLGSAMDKNRKLADETVKSRAKLAAENKKAVNDLDNLRDRTDAYNKSLEDLRNNLQTKYKQGITDFFGSFQTAVMSFTQVFDAIGSVSKNAVVAAASTFENLQARMLTALKGNKQAAKETTDYIIEYARTTPYQITEVTDAVVRLINYGQDIRKVLPAIGDFAAAYRKEMWRTVEAVQDALVGQYQRIKLNFGVTKAMISKHAKELNSEVKLNSRGLVEDQKVLNEALLSWIEKRTKGSSEALSKTFQGAYSNLQDSMQIMYNEIGKYILPKLASVVLGITKVVVKFKDLSEPIKATISGFVSMGLVFTTLVVPITGLLFSIGGLVKAFSAMRAAMISTEAVFAAKNIALSWNTITASGALAIPIIGAVAAAIGAVGLAMIDMENRKSLLSQEDTESDLKLIADGLLTIKDRIDYINKTPLKIMAEESPEDTKKTIDAAKAQINSYIDFIESKTEFSKAGLGEYLFGGLGNWLQEGYKTITGSKDPIINLRTLPKKQELDLSNYLDTDKAREIVKPLAEPMGNQFNRKLLKEARPELDNIPVESMDKEIYGYKEGEGFSPTKQLRGLLQNYNALEVKRREFASLIGKSVGELEGMTNAEVKAFRSSAEEEERIGYNKYEKFTALSVLYKGVFDKLLLDLAKKAGGEDYIDPLIKVTEVGQKALDISIRGIVDVGKQMNAEYLALSKSTYETSVENMNNFKTESTTAVNAYREGVEVTKELLIDEGKAFIKRNTLSTDSLKLKIDYAKQSKEMQTEEGKNQLALWEVELVRREKHNSDIIKNEKERMDHLRAISSVDNSEILRSEENLKQHLKDLGSYIEIKPEAIAQVKAHYKDLLNDFRTTEEQKVEIRQALDKLALTAYNNANSESKNMIKEGKMTWKDYYTSLENYMKNDAEYLNGNIQLKEKALSDYYQGIKNWDKQSMKDADANLKQGTISHADYYKILVATANQNKDKLMEINGEWERKQSEISAEFKNVWSEFSQNNKNNLDRSVITYDQYYANVKAQMKNYSGEFAKDGQFRKQVEDQLVNDLIELHKKKVETYAKIENDIAQSNAVNFRGKITAEKTSFDQSIELLKLEYAEKYKITGDKAKVDEWYYEKYEELARNSSQKMLEIQIEEYSQYVNLRKQQLDLSKAEAERPGETSIVKQYEIQKKYLDEIYNYQKNIVETMKQWGEPLRQRVESGQQLSDIEEKNASTYMTQLKELDAIGDQLFENANQEMMAYTKRREALLVLMEAQLRMGSISKSQADQAIKGFEAREYRKGLAEVNAELKKIGNNYEAMSQKSIDFLTTFGTMSKNLDASGQNSINAQRDLNDNYVTANNTLEELNKNLESGSNSTTAMTDHMVSFNIATEKAVDKTSQIVNNMKTVGTLTAGAVEGMGNFMSQEEALSNLPGGMQAGINKDNSFTMEEMYKKYVSNTLPANIDPGQLKQIIDYGKTKESGGFGITPEGFVDSQGKTISQAQSEQDAWVKTLTEKIDSSSTKTEESIKTEIKDTVKLNDQMMISNTQQETANVNTFGSHVGAFGSAVGKINSGGGSDSGGGSSLDTGITNSEGETVGTTGAKKAQGLMNKNKNISSPTESSIDENTVVSTKSLEGTSDEKAFRNIGTGNQGNMPGNKSGSYKNTNTYEPPEETKSSEKQFDPRLARRQLGSLYKQYLAGELSEDQWGSYQTNYLEQMNYYGYGGFDQTRVNIAEGNYNFGGGTPFNYYSGDFGTGSRGFDIPENDEKANIFGKNLIDKSISDFVNITRNSMVAEIASANKNPKNYFSNLPYNTNIKQGLSLQGISNNTTNNNPVTSETKNITINYGKDQLRMSPSLTKKAEEFSNEAIAYNGLTTIG